MAQDATSPSESPRKRSGERFFECAKRISAVWGCLTAFWGVVTYILSATHLHSVSILKVFSLEVLALLAPYMIIVAAVFLLGLGLIWVRLRRARKPLRGRHFLAALAALCLVIPAIAVLCGGPPFSIVTPCEGQPVGATTSITVRYARLEGYHHVYVVVEEPLVNRCWIQRQDLGGSRTGVATAYSVNIGRRAADRGKVFTIYAIATKSPPTRFDDLDIDELPRESRTSEFVHVPRE